MLMLWDYVRGLAAGRRRCVARAGHRCRSYRVTATALLVGGLLAACARGGAAPATPTDEQVGQTADPAGAPAALTAPPAALPAAPTAAGESPTELPPTPAQVPTTPAVRIACTVVTPDGLNLRANPDASGQVIALLPLGTQVTATERTAAEPFWVRGAAQASSGWLRADEGWLTCDSPPASLPVISPP